MRTYIQLVLTAVLAAAISMQTAEAQRHKEPEGAANDRGLSSAVSRARARTGGRVLSAETQKRNGRSTHVIRILTDDGRVKRVQVDAGNGSRNAPKSRR